MLLRQLKQLGGIVRTLSLIAGVLAIGCMVCAIEEEPGVIEFEGSAIVQIEGEVNGEPNAVTGQLMLGLAKGLTDGNCWGGNTQGYIKGTWRNIRGLPIQYRSLTWIEYLDEISYIGGNGNCDSVIYVSTSKPWHPSGIWHLWEAEVDRCEPMVEEYMPIAEQSPHGSFNDTVMLGDYVQISWELTAHLADASGEGNFGTAQLTYDLAEGMGYDVMPYGLYIDFYYNNADTSRRTVSAETWARSDTFEVRAIYTAQDTIRNRAGDSLFGIDLVNSQGGIIARDTVDRYVPTNKAVKWIETIYLVKWPP